MIEHSIVNGKPAVVAYLKNGFEPATKDDATLVKVMWDDGSMMFLGPGEQPVQKAWEEAQHPRAPDGRFGEVGYGEPTGQMVDFLNDKPISSVQRSAVRDEKLRSDIESAFGQNTGLDDDTLAMWRQTFGNVEPIEVRNAMLGPLDSNKEGSVSSGSGPDGDGIVFSFAGKDENGEWGMSRVIIPANDGNPGMAIHSVFRLPKSMQGKGIAKAVLASQIGLYEKIGVDEVYLNANIDVGGYAWAKYGFVPTALEDLNGYDERIHLERPKDIWRLADSPQGKELLINSDWYGMLDLNDKEAMARFNSYIRRGK